MDVAANNKSGNVGKRGKKQQKLHATKKLKLGPDVGDGGKKKATKKMMRNVRAGLHFPVTRIHRKLKRNKGQRVNVTAAVYTAAVLEYVMAEVIELAGGVAKGLKLKRVTPRHLYLAVRGDEELDLLIRGTIAGGGVVPHIHRSLLGKSYEPKGDVSADMMVAESMPSTSKAGTAKTTMKKQQQAKGKEEDAIEHQDFASVATVEADRDSMLSEHDSVDGSQL